MLIKIVEPAFSRTCFRCGAEFFEVGHNACPACRKTGRIRKPDCRRESRPRRAPRKGDPLTRREKSVVACVVESLPNKLIAYRLRLTEGTIKEYLHGIFVKLGVSNRTELAVLTLRQALPQPNVDHQPECSPPQDCPAVQ